MERQVLLSNRIRVQLLILKITPSPNFKKSSTKSCEKLPG
ncbi:hypothetical protein SaSA20_0862a [Streptococcus agalactiae]|nr:hypothetical protein SaSA20_0862a [Streptococcus agalactiae]